MDPATRRFFLGTLAAIVVVVALVATLAGGTQILDPDAPDGESVVGVVTTIDSSGLTAVRGFTLRAADGRELTFRIGTLENGVEFPPGHLAEHQATVSSVRVWYRSEGDELVAFRLEDADE